MIFLNQKLSYFSLSVTRSTGVLNRCGSGDRCLAGVDGSLGRTVPCTVTVTHAPIVFSASILSVEISVTLSPDVEKKKFFL